MLVSNASQSAWRVSADRALESTVSLVLAGSPAVLASCVQELRASYYVWGGAVPSKPSPSSVDLNDMGQYAAA